MALSQDEQRKLAEIERRLAADDPGFAARMSSFRRPGPLRMLRSVKARIIGSLVTVVIVGLVSLLVYAVLPFRSGGARSVGGRPGAPAGQPVMTVSGGGHPRPATAGAGAGGAAVSGTARQGHSSRPPARPSPGRSAQPAASSGPASSAAGRS
ncbi:MAG TPA: DUF3040 domain-containing protein [Streptosporangiaceae bacterium]|nr:DUF3040 domain-containing protein [Streptosporangiaceae bacterium]